MSIPKVLVVGSGGVGAIAALALSVNKKSEVTLVVRSDYDKVIANGFEFDSVTYGKIENWRPDHVSKNVEQAFKDHGEYDYIVLTTKNIPDGGLTCEEIIKPAVTGKTTIILIQNGIEIEKPMHEMYPKNIILSGVQHIGSTNIDCKVTNKGKDSLFLGVFDYPKHPNLEEYQARALEAANKFQQMYQNKDPFVNLCVIDKNVKQTRWEKLLYNCVFNTTCAILDLDVNRCQIGGGNNTLFRPLMDEVVKIAASEGVTIEDKLKDKFLHIGDGLFYEPSMLIDYRKGQLMEVESILGNPLKIARRNNVDTPTLNVVYNLLHLVQFKILEQRGVITINEDDYKNGTSSDEYPRIFKEKNKNKK